MMILCVLNIIIFEVMKLMESRAGKSLKTCISSVEASTEICVPSAVQETAYTLWKLSLQWKILKPEHNHIHSLMSSLVAVAEIPLCSVIPPPVLMMHNHAVQSRRNHLTKLNRKVYFFIFLHWIADNPLEAPLDDAHGVLDPFPCETWVNYFWHLGSAASFLIADICFRDLPRLYISS